MRGLFLFSVVFVSLALGYTDGSRVPQGNSGEPGSGSPCAGCHTVSMNPSGGRVDLTLPAGASYRPGEKQVWRLRIVDPDSWRRYGFQITAAAGAFTASGNTSVTTSGTKAIANHRSSSETYTLEWTPPAAASGAIAVYLAGAACRGRDDTRVYTQAVTLQPAASARPSLAAAGGVVNAASFASGAVAGAWLSIFGENLAPPGVAREWRAEEIANGVLPRQLEGTSVKINGREAAIAYVSAGQLNVLTAADDASGPVLVEVNTSAGGAAIPVTVNLAPESPALFRFGAQGGKYAAAVHADGVLAGRADLYGTAALLRPARPGDVIQLFGTGFGPTSPPAPDRMAFAGAYPFQNHSSLRVRIGGLAAEILFAGRTAPGLDQLNLRFPNLPPGDHRVEVEINGVGAPGEVYLTAAP